MRRGFDVSDQIAGLDGHPVRVFAVPFDIAAYRVCKGDRYRFAGYVFFQRSFKVVGRHPARLARIIYAAAGVNEPALFVKYEKMRGP